MTFGLMSVIYTDEDFLFWVLGNEPMALYITSELQSPVLNWWIFTAVIFSIFSKFISFPLSS